MSVVDQRNFFLYLQSDRNRKMTKKIINPIFYFFSWHNIRFKSLLTLLPFCAAVNIEVQVGNTFITSKNQAI